MCLSARRGSSDRHHVEALYVTDGTGSSQSTFNSHNCYSYLYYEKIAVPMYVCMYVCMCVCIRDTSYTCCTCAHVVQPARARLHLTYNTFNVDDDGNDHRQH